MKKGNRFLSGLLTLMLGCTFAGAGVNVAAKADVALTDLSSEFSTTKNEFPEAISFTSDTFMKTDGIVVKEELTGAYSIEFDAATGADGSEALGGSAFMITFGNTSATENIGGDAHIGKDDCVTFVVSLGGLNTGRNEYTASGYKIWEDKACTTFNADTTYSKIRANFGWFSGENNYFRFRFDVTEQGNIDVYAGRVGIESELLYINTVGPAESAEDTALTDGYVSILSATKGVLKVMNFKINGESASYEGEDAELAIFGENHSVITENNYYYDNMRLTSEFCIDDSAAANGDVLFDVSYTFNVIGSHGGAQGGWLTVAFMFGMETRDSEKETSGCCESGYAKLMCVKQDGAVVGEQGTLNAYLVNGSGANVRVVAKKGGTLEVTVQEIHYLQPAAVTATYTGMDFNGYMAFDVFDNPSHGGLEFTKITNVSVKTNPAAVKYVPYGVVFENEKTNVAVGGTVTPACSVLPKKAENPGLTYTSANESIATVDSNGAITGVSRGETTVTVTTANGKTDTIFVTVVQGVTGVSLNAQNVALKIGDSYELVATVAPDNADIQTVTFESSDTRVATVSKTGRVTATGGGEATITVTTTDGGFTATCVVKVSQPVTGVVLDVIYAEMQVGETITITPTVNPSKAENNKQVTFVSSDESVATVDQNGKIVAIKEGTATITVTTVEGEYTSDCVIEVVAATKKKASKKGGCNSSVAALCGVVVTAAATTACLFKKKED